MCIQTAVSPFLAKVISISSVYFIRFATQPPEDYPMLTIQAHLMATANASAFDADEVGEMCQFLSTLLMYQVRYLAQCSHPRVGCTKHFTVALT